MRDVRGPSPLNKQSAKLPWPPIKRLMGKCAVKVVGWLNLGPHWMLVWGVRCCRSEHMGPQFDLRGCGGLVVRRWGWGLAVLRLARWGGATARDNKDDVLKLEKAL